MGNASMNTEELRFELNRLNTFRSWPATAAISSDRLTRAGFWYRGTGQLVACYACNVEISDWSYDDQAIMKHRQLSPNCPFLNNRARNVPLHSESTSSSGSSDGSEDLPISRGRPDMVWKNFKSLHKESERRKTFRGWPLSFVSAEELSRAGFFFLRQKDMVQCIFCRGIVLDWEPGDRPMNEHARHFPMCPFVRDCDVGNISTEEEMELPESERGNSEEGPQGQDVCGVHMWDMAMGSVTERQEQAEDEDSDSYYHGEAKYPSYASPIARMRTFESWPKQFPQQPQDLVYAGFFYTGVSDHVKCFCCGEGLRNWERSDDPWVEHARWFSHCKFIKFTKGRDFVEDARKRKPPLMPGKFGKRVASEVDPTAKTGTVTNGSETTLSQSNGYSEAQESGKRSGTADSPSEQKETSAIVSGISEMKFNDVTSEEDLNTKALLEENRVLREMRLCKICMDAEVGVVFRPCGHVVSCVHCTPALQFCPVCRKKIDNSSKVFFSRSFRPIR